MQNVTQTRNLWSYRDRTELGSNVVDTHADISGFSVEAVDGSIGKVDDATYDVGSSHIVVDAGPWIFGKRSCFRQESCGESTRPRSGSS